MSVNGQPDWLRQAIGGNPPTVALTIGELVDASQLGRLGFAITSPAFGGGEALDPCFTAFEEDAVAPPIEWSAPPADALELVLVVENADAAGSKASCHWLVWGLPAQKGKLLEGEAPPRTGKNSAGNSDWLLPQPTVSDGEQRLVFQMFALDLPLALMPGADREDVVAAMKGHVVAASLLIAKTSAPQDDEDDWGDAHDD